MDDHHSATAEQYEIEMAAFVAARAALAPLAAKASDFGDPAWRDAASQYETAMRLLSYPLRPLTVARPAPAPRAHRDCPRCGTPVECCDCAERAGR